MHCSKRNTIPFLLIVRYHSIYIVYQYFFVKISVLSYSTVLCIIDIRYLFRKSGPLFTLHLILWRYWTQNYVSYLLTILNPKLCILSSDDTEPKTMYLNLWRYWTQNYVSYTLTILNPKLCILSSDDTEPKTMYLILWRYWTQNYVSYPLTIRNSKLCILSSDDTEPKTMYLILWRYRTQN